MDDQSVRQEWIDIRVEADFHRELNRTRFGELPDTTWSLLKIESLKWADTFSKGCRRRTFVGVGLYFFQQFVGINVCMTDYQYLGYCFHSKKCVFSWAPLLRKICF